jgi:hypothetical protein
LLGCIGYLGQSSRTEILSLPQIFGGYCLKDLAARLCDPFEILDIIGLVAYMLALPSSINVHNVFHVSLLKKYVHDPSHVIDWHLIQVETEGYFQVHPV